MLTRSRYLNILPVNLLCVTIVHFCQVLAASLSMMQSLGCAWTEGNSNASRVVGCSVIVVSMFLLVI